MRKNRMRKKKKKRSRREKKKKGSIKKGGTAIVREKEKRKKKKGGKSNFLGIPLLKKLKKIFNKKEEKREISRFLRKGKKRKRGDCKSCHPPG